MPFIVTHSWIPMKKDFSGSKTEEFLTTSGPKALAATGLLHAYNAKPAKDGPITAELFGVFDSLESVAAARESADGQAVKKAFDDAADTSTPPGPLYNTFEFEKDFVPVANSPVVQVTALVVPADKVAELNKVWAAVIGDGVTKVDGAIESTYGWGLTEVDVEGGGGKGKVFMVAVGWDTQAHADASKAAREEQFADVIKIAKPWVRYIELKSVK